MTPRVIAIDGPAGAGKSTVARALAERLGFTYLDSGAMYRAVALAAVRRGVQLDDGEPLGALASALEIALDGPVVRLDGEDVSAAIRKPVVSAAASQVSVHSEVRSVVAARQRAMLDDGGYVVEGRDIGTVVAPDASLKVFLTARPDERARRRAAETGESAKAVLAALHDRDRRDTDREHAPMRAASDAVEVDTTGLAVADVVDGIAALAAERGLAP
jgi:cytidylate kinase